MTTLKSLTLPPGLRARLALLREALEIFPGAGDRPLTVVRDELVVDLLAEVDRQEQAQAEARARAQQARLARLPARAAKVAVVTEVGPVKRRRRA